MAIKNSGLITYKPGDVIFNQGDTANCLYIIQKGQMRLYIPKGRGQVDLAILRSGEVIGEMAFFDEKSMTRSCSAAAIVTTEVVKISFGALTKAIEGLNPWLKTLIFTLADRLRKTNNKVKQLEENSVSFSRDGKLPEYKFFQTVDILRILGTIYLVAKTHGEPTDSDKWKIHINKLKYYLYDIYSLKDIKYEELMQILTSENFITRANDENGLPNVIIFDDVEQLRNIVTFINKERMLDDLKKTSISSRCITVMTAAIAQAEEMGNPGEVVNIDLSKILKHFKENNILGNDQDLMEAVAANLCDDIVVGKESKLTVDLFYTKAKKIFPALRFQNAIVVHNESRSGARY